MGDVPVRSIITFPLRRGIRPEQFGRAYPDRIGSRHVRDGFRRDGVAGVLIDEKAGRGETGIDAQPLARLIQMSVDGVLGDAELAGDLLGAEVLIHQPQALAFALSQKIDGQCRSPTSKLAHNGKILCKSTEIVHNSFSLLQETIEYQPQSAGARRFDQGARHLKARLAVPRQQQWAVEIGDGGVLRNQ